MKDGTNPSHTHLGFGLLVLALLLLGDLPLPRRRRLVAPVVGARRRLAPLPLLKSTLLQVFSRVVNRAPGSASAPAAVGVATAIGATVRRWRPRVAVVGVSGRLLAVVPVVPRVLGVTPSVVVGRVVSPMMVFVSGGRVVVIVVLVALRPSVPGPGVDWKFT